MNRNARPDRIVPMLPTFAFVVLAAVGQYNAAAASPPMEVECFTEPYKSVDVPAAEIGVLSSIHVREGDAVVAGQLVAQLDDEVLQRSLEVARAAKDASGSLRAAMSELDTREQQLESYRALRRNDNATDRELQRALSTVATAQAKVQIVRDELEVRRMEYERTKAQLKKRRISSPINGTVITIAKESGEFVSPTDPIVMSVVDLSRLRAVFSIPRAAASSVKVGDVAKLLIGEEGQVASGTVEFVSPTADPQSGTVRVKVRIENESGRLPCGAICRWSTSPAESGQRISRSSTTQPR